MVLCSLQHSKPYLSSFTRFLLAVYSVWLMHVSTLPLHVLHLCDFWLTDNILNYWNHKILFSRNRLGNVELYIGKQ